MNAEVKQKAVTQALAVRTHSYAPYSHFSVGAAIVTDDNTIFTGTNVENASYGATVCAERIALFSAVSAGYRRFSALVIAADTTDGPTYPCGLCRQVLSEFAPDIPIILVDAASGTILEETSLSVLLPHQFSLHH